MSRPTGPLLDISRLLQRRGCALAETLDAVAAAIAEPLGFRTVAINLYRPAFDDFEVVAVHGSDGARDALLSTATPAEEWERLIVDRFRRRGAYVIEHGVFDWASEFSVSYLPPVDEGSGAPATRTWHPEDAIFVPLRAADGTVLGIVSVDEPVSGLCPDDDQLDQLAAVAAQASLAVESAQHAEEARRQRAAVEHLLHVSARLSEERSVDDVLAAVAQALREALGFEKVMVWLSEADQLRVRCALGWQEGDVVWPDTPVDVMERLFREENLHEGCLLLGQADAHALTPPELHGVYRSVRNGRGPQGWYNHWLLAPMRAPDGALAGAIWVDDPIDHRTPAAERLQALRAFTNQASSALATARRIEQLRHLAHHDPLTGLRNRRGLEDRMAAALEEGAAIVVLDIDHFKRVNDSLGYEAGDALLREIAALIATERRGGDLPVRLGGEEFALVLPGADGRGALAVAERLRRAVRDRIRSVPGGVTVSAGVAAGRGGHPGSLLRDATRALYAAKRLGRDRSVVYAADTLETLIGNLERESASAEQLSAVMMLAETLDLRDAGTARHSHTVGHFAQSIAAELGWTADRVERLRVAGVLHDIGKLAVADSILHKPGPLTPEERTEVERHPEVGSRILEGANLRDVAEWVACHHERVDGRGYPARLPADRIPVEARILAVADAYEAMIADRPYRSGMPPEAARDELLRHAGTQFDAGIVEAFLRVLARGDGAA